jgi:hypothetical protein
MITNILCQVVLSLVTNTTNANFDLPTGAPGSPGKARHVMTNVFERATITWVISGRTNVCTSDKLIYTATQVLRLQETWVPQELMIRQP